MEDERIILKKKIDGEELIGRMRYEGYEEWSSWGRALDPVRLGFNVKKNEVKYYFQRQAPRVEDQIDLLIPIITCSALVLIFLALITTIIVRRKKAELEQHRRGVVEL